MSSDRICFFKNEEELQFWLTFLQCGLISFLPETSRRFSMQIMFGTDLGLWLPGLLMKQMESYSSAIITQYLNVSSSLLLMFLRTWVEFQTKMLSCLSKLKKKICLWICLKKTLHLRILVAVCCNKDWLVDLDFLFEVFLPTINLLKIFFKISFIFLEVRKKTRLDPKELYITYNKKYLM